MDNIYIIGYRATGKSKVSDLLSKKIGKQVVHMDAELVNRIGTISAFVQNNGWSRFRDEEAMLLLELQSRKELIVDCGGGIIERDKNIRIMKGSGKVIWLKAGSDTIQRRLNLEPDQANRPSLTGTGTINEIEEVLSKRIPSYEKAADLAVDTDNKTIKEVCLEIEEKIKHED